MFEALLSDTLDLVNATFLKGDAVSMGIAFGSVLIAAALMKRGSQLSSMTFLALSLFAAGGYLRSVFSGTRRITADRLIDRLEDSLEQFLDLTTATSLSYFLGFMGLILLFYVAKSLFARG